MALNWTMLNPNRTPVPLPRESTIMTVDSGVDLSLTIPDVPPTTSATSGGSGGERKLKGTGKLFLTDQRLVFVSDGDGDSTGLDTLTLPLPSILSTRFEQPYLGSNYLSIDIRPASDGGLTSGTKAEVRFKSQGIFQFVSLLEKNRERAIYMRRQMQEEEETLRKLIPFTCLLILILQ
ncbi:hypothetical protein B0F90DRAFT_1622760 [Multifurca ochricompacta]|uniref:GRAM domain-containing protein n=1 Tax=Multifurca ochricompacta TaxID=376703 RepID=A0AAD4MC32_9AGAM|nr:hypothetical protein B0F90DRAFT_1622760 [Multifurca ochricompacta]